MRNVRTEQDWEGRAPEHRKTVATGNHEQPSTSADDLQNGYTRSTMTGTDRYMDDGVRRERMNYEDFDVE